MKAGRAQCPACFFCFLAREIFRDVRTKTFSTHVRAKITALVRKTGLSAHVREDFFRGFVGPCVKNRYSKPFVRKKFANFGGIAR